MGSDLIPIHTLSLLVPPCIRAGDTDVDGAIGYDEFVMLARHAYPDLTVRIVTKMYSEAVRALPSGTYLIPREVFIKVAHSYGLDRWD